MARPVGRHGHQIRSPPAGVEAVTRAAQKIRSGRLGVVASKPLLQTLLGCSALSLADGHSPDDQAKRDFVQHISDVVNDVERIGA